MVYKTKKAAFTLILIVILAGVLRIVGLQTQPPSLNWDEISHGYNAYSILKTGADEWGQSFPLANFRAYGDYPLTLNLYLTIPFIAALGLNEFSIRLPHALLGVLTAISVYYLVWGLTKKKNYSLLAAFLVAIEPWFVFTSRFVLQSNLSVFLLITGMAALFNRKSHKLLLPLSIICFGLTLFSYHTTRIFTPLLLLSLIFIYRKEILTKLSVFLMILFFLPLPFILINPTARARSNEVFLLNPSVVYSIEVARNASSLPPIVKRIVFNKPVHLATSFAKNYFDYFSPHFLFLEGGTQYQFSVPHHGLLYLAELPFFYIGLAILLFKSLKKRDKAYLALLAWLVLSPIPASITTERFAVLRATSMLPLPEILVTLGFIWSATYAAKRFKIKTSHLTMGFVAILLVSLISYLSNYLGEYRTNYSWAWQYGYKEAVLYANTQGRDYHKIIMTKKYGEPHEFVLFYSKWDPAQYKSDPHLVRFTKSNWWWTDSFDKYVFVNDWEIPEEGRTFVTESKTEFDCTGLRCLLITSPGNAPRNWKKLETVKFLDQKPAFEIYENQ